MHQLRSRPTLLDDLVPTYDAASRHTIRVAASPAHVYEAARHADLGHLWLVCVLMGLRAVPAWTATALHRRRPTIDVPTGERRYLHAGRRGAGGRVRPRHHRSLLDANGRSRKGGCGPVSAPTARGLAQAVWNFRVQPRVGGSELSTETRVRCADPAARQQFLRYWRVIRPGSALIRASMLRHIRNAAERGAV